MHTPDTLPARSGDDAREAGTGADAHETRRGGGAVVSVSWIAVVWLVGQAIAFQNGAWSPGALALILAALILGVWTFNHATRSLRRATTAPRASPVTAPQTAGATHLPEGGVTPFTLHLLWIALVTSAFAAIADRKLLLYGEEGEWAVGRAVQWPLLLLAGSYWPGFDRWLAGRWPVLTRRRVWSHARFSAIGVLVLVAALAVPRGSPAPKIDAFTVQQEAARATLQGTNPYTTVRVDTTGRKDWAPPTVPYAYPPAQLLATLPGYATLGDVRFSMIAAFFALGWLLRVASGPGTPGGAALLRDAPALFIWLFPKGFFLLEQSWTDPVPATLLAGAAWLIVRGPSGGARSGGSGYAGAALLGVALAAKQSMFWLAPLAFLLPGLTFRHAAVALVAALLPTAPFLIDDPGALIQSLASASGGASGPLPVHPNGLAFSTWLLKATEMQLPGAVAFIGAALVVAIALVRRRRSLHAFAAAATLTYLTFFAFNRWAFANYYFFVMALAALAAAAALDDKNPASE